MSSVGAAHEGSASRSLPGDRIAPLPNYVSTVSYCSSHGRRLSTRSPSSRVAGSQRPDRGGDSSRAGLRTALAGGQHLHRCGWRPSSSSIVASAHRGLGAVPHARHACEELGLDTATVDAEVMSVNLGDEDEEPMIFYRDPMQFMTHLADKHGTDAVAGMAGLIGWSQGPAKALGRFDVCTPPKTIDEMYACAANEAERTAIHDVIFGSAMDAIDRYLPDKHKHAVLRSMLAFLAINSTYRGPYTPGSATCLAFALAVPDDTAAMMTKLEGGIGALCEHLHQTFVSNGARSGTAPRSRRFSSRASASRACVCATDPRSALRLSFRICRPITRSSSCRRRTCPPTWYTAGAAAITGRRSCRSTSRSTAFQFAPPYEFLNEPGMQGSIGIFNSPEETTRQWEECRQRHRPGQSVDGNVVPVRARPEHGAPRQARRKRVRVCIPG